MNIVLIALTGVMASYPGNAAPKSANPTLPVGSFTRRMSEHTAICIAERDPKLIVEWLETLPGSQAEAALVRRREGNFAPCFGSTGLMGDWQPAYDYPSMREVVIRTLILGKVLPVPSDRPPGLNDPKWFKQSAAPSGNERVASLANDLGYCLAKSDWTATRMAVLSVPNSGDRQSAMKKLVPLVAGCVPPRARMTLDVSRLTAIIEETVYHASGGVTTAMLAARANSKRKLD